METKMILIGIVLTGIVAACGATNSDSQKFDPSKINGKYYNHTITHNNESTFARTESKTWIKINYPNIYGCLSIGHPDKSNFNLQKETLKVTHKKGNVYKVTTMNGHNLAT